MKRYSVGYLSEFDKNEDICMVVDYNIKWLLEREIAL